MAATFTCLEGSAKGKVLSSASAMLPTLAGEWQGGVGRGAQATVTMALNVAYAKTVDVEVACIKNNVETDRMIVTGGKFAQAMTNNHEEWTLAMVGVGGKGALFLNRCEALAATPVLTAGGQVSRGASETTVLKRP